MDLVFNGYGLLWVLGVVYCLYSFLKSIGIKSMKDLLSLGFLIALFASWCTHVIVCLIQAKYLLLIAGAFIFPVGMIHGVGIWFGVSW